MEDSKTCDYSDNVDNYRFILPFRLCLVGEMSSGKSSFVLNLLKDFKRQTNIIYTKKQIDLYFCYSNQNKEYLQSIEHELRKTTFFRKFIPIHKISSRLMDVENYSNIGVHSLIILEDLQYFIRNLNKDTSSLFNNFLLESRHKDISLIYIMHTYPETNASKSTTFDRNFFEQCSDIIFFRSLHNKKIMSFIGSRVFGDFYQDFKQIFKIIEKIYNKLYSHTRTHIVVSSDFRKNLDNLNRIRFDIFEKQLCIRHC